MKLARKAMVVVCAFSLGCTHFEPPADEEPTLPVVADDPVEECIDGFDGDGLECDEAASMIEPATEEESPVVVEDSPTPEPHLITEPEAAPEEPTAIAEPEVTPEPIAAPGFFRRLARVCDVLAEPLDSADVLNSIEAGRRIWTEMVDERFVRVFRRAGDAYLKAECFAPAPAAPVVAAEPAVVEPEPKPEPAVSASAEALPKDPPAPPPPPLPPTPEAYEQPRASAPLDQGMSPVTAAIIGSAVLLGLFFLYNSRRRRIAEDTRTVTLTAF